jgi:DNA-binding NarL/FixJ family response regulator
MQNQKETEPEQTGKNKQIKPKKKEGKIEKVWQLSQKGSTVADIAKKTGLDERVVRSYVWRKANVDKYKALLARYQEKRKKKLAEKQLQKEPSKEEKIDSKEKA